MAKISKYPSVPECPKALPDDIVQAARNLALAYWNSPIRPKLKADVINHWDKLIDEWAEHESLPLLIRKQSDDIGNILQHSKTSRKLAPCDNSPAHWAVITAHACGANYSIKDVESALANHKIPMTMAMNKYEVENAQMKGLLAKCEGINASTYGWKVDHIDEVGLKQRNKLEELPMDDLKRHFKRLMKPSNIVLVPSVLKGLGDMPEFIRVVKEYSQPTDKR